MKGLYATGNVDLAYRKSQQASQCRNIGIAISLVLMTLNILITLPSAY